MRGARYFRRVLLTAAVLIAVHLGIMLTVRSKIPAEYWIREFQVIKRFQIGGMNSPKIVFLGGSATLFGIDAAEVENALGMPAFNYGLHAGMGLQDLLGEARRTLKSGDVLVLLLEPPYYRRPGTDWTVWQLRNSLAWNHEALDLLPFFQRLVLCARASNPELSFDLCWSCFSWKLDRNHLRRREEATAPDSIIVARYLAQKGTAKHFAFDMSNLDEHGDIQHAEGKKYPLSAPLVSPIEPGAIQSDIKVELAEFLAEMRSRHVSFYFDYTPYFVEKPPGTDWRKAEALFVSEIQSLGSEVLESRDRCFYPYRLLFDYELHLNTQGRALRTKSMIEALRPKLAHTHEVHP